MVDKVGMNLYETWREAVDAYFHKEDWILNLASKEYAKMVNHPKVVTIEFWELRGDTYKQIEYVLKNESWHDGPCMFDGASETCAGFTA